MGRATTEIKITYNQTKRLFWIAKHMQWSQLAEQIMKAFNLGNEYTIKLSYIDSEKDELTLDSKEELHDAINKNILKFKLQATMDTKSQLYFHKQALDKVNQSPSSKMAAENVEKYWFKYLASQKKPKKWMPEGPSIDDIIGFMEYLAGNKKGLLNEKISKAYFKILCSIFRRLVRIPFQFYYFYILCIANVYLSLNKLDSRKV